MEKLHPGAKWLFRIGAYGTLIVAFTLIVPIFVNVFIFGMFATGDVSSAGSIFSKIFISIIVGLFFVVIFGEVYARLAYKNWTYEFTDHNLKLERGIIWKKYSNVPYERVQNVDIRRGIIARMMGFSTVDIQTAGAAYSGRGGLNSEGHIPAVGVKHAEDIREFLMKKISRKSNQGM